MNHREERQKIKAKKQERIEIKEEKGDVDHQEKMVEQERPFPGIWIGLGALLLIVLLIIIEILFF